MRIVRWWHQSMSVLNGYLPRIHRQQLLAGLIVIVYASKVDTTANSQLMDFLWLAHTPFSFNMVTILSFMLDPGRWRRNKHYRFGAHTPISLMTDLHNGQCGKFCWWIWWHSFAPSSPSTANVGTDVVNYGLWNIVVAVCWYGRHVRIHQLGVGHFSYFIFSPAQMHWCLIVLIVEILLQKLHWTTRHQPLLVFWNVGTMVKLPLLRSLFQSTILNSLFWCSLFGSHASYLSRTLLLDHV